MRQETIVDPVQAESAYQWFELFMPAILVILSVVIPAWLTYKTWKIKQEVNRRNRIMAKAAEESGESFTETTMFNVFTEKKKK